MRRTSVRATRLTSVAAAAGVTDWLGRASLRLRFNQGEVDPRIQSGASSMGWLWDSTGTVRPRPHNLVPNSDVLTQSTGTTVAVNSINDDRGLLVADYLQEDATSGEHFGLDGSFEVSAGLIYTWSFKAKEDGSGRRAVVRGAAQGSAAVAFDIATGSATIINGTALLTHGSEVLTDGWRRCWIRYAPSSTGNAVFRVQIGNGSNTVYQGEPGKGFYVAGRQLNLGELQPYHPTTSTAYFGPRLTYDPADLSLPPGLLAEEARTNSIRNSTMQGAVAGTQSCEQLTVCSLRTVFHAWKLTIQLARVLQPHLVLLIIYQS